MGGEKSVRDRAVVSVTRLENTKPVQLGKMFYYDCLDGESSSDRLRLGLDCTVSSSPTKWRS